MVIRRIRDHVAAYNWFAVAIDVSIVVVGVFLGLQANNWNAARIEQAEARAYRAQIIENLRANEIDIGARAAYYRQVYAHAIAALNVMETPGSAMDEPFLVDTYQSTQVWLRPLVQTAYDEMSSAGLGRSVGDSTTRTRLTAFYSQVPQFNATALSATAYRERVRRAIPFTVQKMIRDRCGDIVRALPSGVQSATLPDRCELDLDRATVVRAAARLGATRDLDQDLTRHIADLYQKRALFARYGQLARELRLHLQSLDQD